MPNAGIDSTGTPVVFHSCDPGRRAITPDDAAIREATSLAVGRDAVAASLVSAHVPGQIAVCAARMLVQQPTFRDEMLGAKPSASPAELVSQGAAAAVACRRNALAGLP